MYNNTLFFYFQTFIPSSQKPASAVIEEAAAVERRTVAEVSDEPERRSSPVGLYWVEGLYSCLGNVNILSDLFYLT